MKKIFIFPIVLIVLSVNLFSVEPRDFNGGWLNNRAYNFYLDGDEYLVDQTGIITIDGIDYFYCLVGTVVDLSSNAPRFCITYFDDFDVLDIKRISVDTFELKLLSRHDPKMAGRITLTMKDCETFYFDIIDGSKLFFDEIDCFTKKNNCYFKKLQKNK